MDKKELFICECNSIEHQIVMSYFEDEKEVYCNVHLKPERNVSNELSMLLSTYLVIEVHMEILTNLFSILKMQIGCKVLLTI